MDSSFMGNRIVDQEGHILYSNQAFLDIFGYADIDDALTHPPRDQFTPGSYRDFTSRVDKIKRGEPAADMLEIDIIRGAADFQEVLQELPAGFAGLVGLAPVATQCSGDGGAQRSGAITLKTFVGTLSNLLCICHPR